MLVYGILDPEGDDFRYVGKTRDLEMRLAYHLTQKPDDAAHAWMRSVGLRWLVDTTVVLETAPPAVATPMELYWMALVRLRGDRLFSREDLDSRSRGRDPALFEAAGLRILRELGVPRTITPAGKAIRDAVYEKVAAEARARL